MSVIDLEKLLGGDAGLELEQAPASHHLRTPQCPPTPRFYNGVRHGWDAETREHVTHCEFCQRATALEWRIECPELFTLVRYLAQGDSFEDSKAMQFHLATDGCRRCELALRTIFVATLVSMLKARTRPEEQIKGWAGRAVLTHKRLPRWDSHGARCAGEDARFEALAGSDEEGLTVSLWEKDSETLELTVEASRVVPNAQVEIVGTAGEKRLEKLKLKQIGEYSAGSRSLGPFREQAQTLGEECLVLAAPAIEDLGQ